MTFYGRSFITDHTGAIIEEADRRTPNSIVTTFDLDQVRDARVFWGIFRDRRPNLYQPLLTLDGRSGQGKGQ